MKQKGFSLVEGLLILLVVLLIGFAGFYVWDRNNEDDEDGSQNMTQNSADAVADDQANTPEEQTGTASGVETRTLVIGSSEVDVPQSWLPRICGDHDGYALIAAGSDGPAACISSDATWLDTSMSRYGRVAVGASSNPFPRQDYSGGQQKEVYESDATELQVTDGRTALKFSYTADRVDQKGEYFSVVEYVLDDTTFLVFGENGSDDTFSDGGQQLTTDEIIELVETVVLPSLRN